MTQNLTHGERIHSIDIIRGIAVLGIFLVNWPVIAGVDSRDLSGIYEGIDSYIRLFYDMFIQTKFYTIFSFLFGLGFYIFMSRAEAKTDRPKTLFVRAYLFYYYSVSYITFFYGTVTFYILMRLLDFSYFYFIRENLVLF